MAQQQEFARQLAQVIEILARLGAEIARWPGVVAVGPGPERRQGKPTGRPAIVVTVRRKQTPDELREEGIEPFPEELEGFPVDVAELGRSFEDLETRREIAAAIEIKDRIADEWLRQENVTGVGVGYKIEDGVPTRKVALQIFVAAKLAEREVAARGLKMVPREISGWPTDVVQLGRLVETASPSGSRGDRRDPLAGGLSIGHASSPFTFGTLGAVAFDNANRAVVLSNEHVLDGDIGETVHQPSPVGLDDSFEVALQLDVCNPLSFVRIDTPNTVGGSILAGAAAAAALAAALSDEIDPTREGQAATVPPAGAKTLEEQIRVKIHYPEIPIPGTPFQLDVDWRYQRRTDMGNFSHSDSPHRRNPHTLLYHRLFVHRPHYSPADTIQLFGLVIPHQESRLRCASLHCVALLSPLHLDQTVPVVLRELGPHDPRSRRFLQALAQAELSEEEKKILSEFLRNPDGQRHGCLFYGELAADNLPLGRWRHWMHVQKVNTVPAGTDPLVAAQTIGGLPLSSHYKQTLDVACGPFVFEDDGSFDIELLSI